MSARQNVAIRVQTEGKAEVKRDWQEIGQAGVSAQDQIARSSDKASAAMDRQLAKWSAMARAAKEAEQIERRQAAFNGSLGIGAAPGKSAKESAEAFAALLAEREVANDVVKRKVLTTMQRNTLIYTASDIVSSAGSNISPTRMLMQQGPQVLQAFAIGGAEASASMLKLIGIMGTAAAGIGVATAAWLSHRDAIAQADVVAKGLAITAGLTGEEIEGLARKGAEAGRVTIGAARDMASAYLSTGRVGGDVTTTLIALTQRYAVATGQDAKKATEELAKAMAEPAKGADTLNGKLHFLDDTTIRYVQTLVSQNKTTEAQLVLADALANKLQNTSNHVSTLGGVWDVVKTKASAAWDAMGRGVDFLTHNQTDLQRLAELNARRAMRASTGAGMFGVRPAWWDAEDKEVAEIQARLDAARKEAERAQANQAAGEARAVIAKVKPLTGKLRELEAQRSVLKAGYDELSPETQREADAALKKLDADIAAVKAGYKDAADMAAKLAAAHRKSAEEARKAAAEAKKHAEEERLQDQLRVENLAQLAKLRGDAKTLAMLEEQVRLQKLIKEYEQAGLTAPQARAAAERQVGQEMIAWNAGMVKATKEAAEGMKPLAWLQRGWDRVRYDKNQDALDSFYRSEIRAFDALSEKLTDTQGRMRSWGETVTSVIADVIADFERLAVINPLKNFLFGDVLKVSGYQDAPQIKGVSSFFASLFQRGAAPGNANGTDNWQGGWSWVGERGPEPVWMPPGSRVVSNAQAALGMGGHTFNFTLNAPGADASAARALQLEVAQLKRDLPALIVRHTNEGLSRRRIG